MDSFSTVNILMNLYTTVYELYGKLTNIEIAKAAIPYPLFDDRTPNLLPSLPDHIKEFNFWIVESERVRASVSFAFDSRRLVNFNTQVFPKEWLKKRAVTDAVELRLLPYVVSSVGHNWDSTPDGLMVRDPSLGLIHSVRQHLKKPVTVSASIMAEHVDGMDTQAASLLDIDS